MDGRVEEAQAAYTTAARLATSIPEQRYLNTKARAVPREPAPLASAAPEHHPS